MNILHRQTWIFFYLICFVALLWASFLLTQGIMLGFSLTIMMVVIGFNFILISIELKEFVVKKEQMKALSTRNDDTPAH